MLFLRICINSEKIDEVWVHRVKGKTSGICEYSIRKPEGFEYIVIRHRYLDGYVPLVKKVMAILKKTNYQRISP